MGRKGRNSSPVDEIRVKGFARLQLVDRITGHIQGDSGWFQNTVCDIGRDEFIAAVVGQQAGSSLASVLQLATQTTSVAATQTLLTGETRVRKTANRSTLTIGTFRMTASWSSTDNTAAVTIGAIGVFDNTTAAGGSLAAGQTFTTSQWASNQNVNASYEWRF